MHSVLFICTANICRSPMVAALLRAYVAGQNGEWRVASAGTWTMDGIPAAENTIWALHKRSIDASGHRSRQVTRKLVDDYRLILTMERGQKEAMRIEFPEAAGRIYLLSEMVGQVFDINDPIGSPPAEFDSTAREFEDLIVRGFDRISQLSDEGESAWS
jgi:protein-tyrosine-phosphatase